MLILKVSLWVSSLGDEIAEITEGCSAPKCSLPVCARGAHVGLWWLRKRVPVCVGSVLRKHWVSSQH